MFPEAVINGRPVAMYSRERRHAAGYGHIQARDVAGLDKSACEPVEPPPKMVLRAWEKLGFSDEEWTKAGAMAVQEAGRYFTMKLTGRVLLVKGMRTIGEVEMAMKWARDILESQSKEVEMFHKLTAAQLIPVCAKAFHDLSGRMMDLAEKSADKVSNEKPRNLPPTVAVQVNVAGRPSPSAQATSASCGRSDDADNGS